MNTSSILKLYCFLSIFYCKDSKSTKFQTALQKMAFSGLPPIKILPNLAAESVDVQEFHVVVLEMNAAVQFWHFVVQFFHQFLNSPDQIFRQFFRQFLNHAVQAVVAAQ